jgi:phage-related protein (TIGR01555 family)
MRLFRRPAFPIVDDSVRLDGVGGRWVNSATGRGGPMDRHAGTTFDRPMPLDGYQVDALNEFCALGRRIIWREPADALRPGFRLEWEGQTPALERTVYRWLRRRYDLIGKMKQARAFARASGGGAIVVIAQDGRDPSEPIDLPNLKRVVRLVVKDRYEIWPDPQIDYDPESIYYGTARHYIVQGATKRLRVHASRVIRFDGLPVTDRSRQQRNGWGGSYFDLIYTELRNYGSSHEDAAEAITLLTQGVFKVAGYADAVSKNDSEFVGRRYAAMRLGMGTLGDIVLDSNESYEVQSRTFAGLAELLAALTKAVIAACDMPEVVISGNRSAGLNGGSEGDDLRAWYDLCGSERTDHYEQQLLDLLAILLAVPDSPTGGIVPDDLGVDWPAMWQPTETQAAEIRVQRSTARASDIAAGVIDETEARTDDDLGEYYDLADTDPETGEPVTPRPPSRARSLEPDETDNLLVQDESAIPAGETPVSATAAAKRLGFASPAPILRFIREGRIRVWRAGKGSPYRVLLSEVTREMHQPLEQAAGVGRPTNVADASSGARSGASAFA